MILIFEIAFWFSVGIIAHSYVLYPLIIRILSCNKKDNPQTHLREEDLPMVSILLSVYNEESVIEEKIISIANSNYPNSKFELLIGSDCSNDNTNTIIEQLLQKYNYLY